MIEVKPLSAQYDRSAFDCGEEELNRYLREQASQDIKRRTTRVFIAISENQIAGFYSLSATEILRDTLPENLARKLPKYPLPCLLIGRLAVDKSHQKRRLGEYLLIDAMRRGMSAGETMGLFAVVVDAKHEKAKDFYRKYGFIELANMRNRMFLPFDTVAFILKEIPS